MTKVNKLPEFVNHFAGIVELTNAKSHWYPTSNRKGITSMRLRKEELRRLSCCLVRRFFLLKNRFHMQKHQLINNQKRIDELIAGVETKINAGTSSPLLFPLHGALVHMRETWKHQAEETSAPVLPIAINGHKGKINHLVGLAFWLRRPQKSDL